MRLNVFFSCSPCRFSLRQASKAELDHFHDHVKGKYYGWKDPVTGDIGIPPSVREAQDVLQRVRVLGRASHI